MENIDTENTVESRDIWAAAHRIGVYGTSEEMLRALIARHRDGPVLTDRVIGSAVCH
jgi:hypothetical protein